MRSIIWLASLVGMTVASIPAGACEKDGFDFCGGYLHGMALEDASRLEVAKDKLLIFVDGDRAGKVDKSGSNAKTPPIRSQGVRDRVDKTRNKRRSLQDVGLSARRRGLRHNV